MVLSERRATLKLDYALAVAACVLLILVGLGLPGFWEPWESGVVQLAEFVHEHPEQSEYFWVPQNDNHLVHKPLGLIWSLVGVYSLSSEPGELALRLPGAMLGMAMMLLIFAVMRRFFSRRAAFSSLAVTLSLPLFVFSARLLTSAIWQLAGVSIPLLLYLLATHAQTERERWGYGLALGLSFLLAFLGGGIVSLSVVVGTLLIFLAWCRRKWAFRVFAQPIFLLGFSASLIAGFLIFDNYRQNVAFAIEDRVDIDARTLNRHVADKHVAAIGVRDGLIVGQYTEEGQRKHGVERFLLSQDGSALGTPEWQAWLTSPDDMNKLMKALEKEHARRIAAGEAPLLLDVEGALELGGFNEPPSGVGATRAALEFFLYDLFNPNQLVEGEKATVRAQVDNEPGLRKVFTRPLSPEELVEALGEVEEEPAKKTPAKTPPDAKTPEQEKLEVAEIKNGQEVTLLGEVDDAGWVEVETSGSRRGYVRAVALEMGHPLGYLTFDNWVRYVGFGLFPWIMLLPFGIGFLLRHRVAEDSEAQGEIRAAVGAYFVIWLGLAGLALGLGSSLLGQRFFLGVVPVAVGVSALIGNEQFWSQLSEAPLMRKLMGFAAICVAVTLLHDYFEQPWLFVEPYLAETPMEWDEELRVMEKPYRYFRFFIALVMVGVFFGAVGWGGRVLVGITTYLSRRFSTLIERFEALHQPAKGWSSLSLSERIWRICTGIWRGFVRWIAVGIWVLGQFFTRGRVALLTLGVVFTSMTTFVYLPAMSHHLTQKGILERYEELKQSDEEKLFAITAKRTQTCKKISDCGAGSVCVQGKCRVETTSFYLGKVDTLPENDLIERFLQPMRSWGVIPRKELARLNSVYRKKQKNRKPAPPLEEVENLYVLDARSSRALLVSNLLRPGEVDENFVAPLILKAPPSPEYPVARPTVFQNGLEFVGYDLDPDQVGSGDELTVTYYFKVTKDINRDWQMFLHIDFPGNRINGDHYPGDGDFRTNTWLAGDYVKDVQKLKIDRGSSAGDYEMWFGFFSSGDNRLKVTSGDIDKDNRVRMGRLRVTGGI